MYSFCTRKGLITRPKLLSSFLFNGIITANSFPDFCGCVLMWFKIRLFENLNKNKLTSKDLILSRLIRLSIISLLFYVNFPLRLCNRTSPSLQVTHFRRMASVTNITLSYKGNGSSHYGLASEAAKTPY